MSSPLVARLVPDEGTARLHGSARPAPPGPFSKAVGTGAEARGVDLSMPLAPAVEERRHSRIERTVRYLGIEVDDAIEIAAKINIAMQRRMSWIVTSSMPN